MNDTELVERIDECLKAGAKSHARQLIRKIRDGQVRQEMMELMGYKREHMINGYLITGCLEE